MKTKEQLIEWFVNLNYTNQLSLYEGKERLGIEDECCPKCNCNAGYSNGYCSLCGFREDRTNKLIGMNKRINSVGYKGELRKCIGCGDVKIWDYPNQRKCPNGIKHKWRPIPSDELTEEENKSITEQIKKANGVCYPK